MSRRRIHKSPSQALRQTTLCVTAATAAPRPRLALSLGDTRLWHAFLVMHLLALLLGVALVSAAEPDPEPKLLPALTFRSGSRRIVIPQRNAAGPHDFTQDSCNGYTIETTMLHAALRRGDTLYVVYTCGGHSRGPEARLKRCGAGWEHQINWVAIRGGCVIEHQQRDLQSCTRTRGQGEIFRSLDGWRGTKLCWSDGWSTGDGSGFFDSASPEAGLQPPPPEEQPKP